MYLRTNDANNSHVLTKLSKILKTREDYKFEQKIEKYGLFTSMNGFNY